MIRLKVDPTQSKCYASWPIGALEGTLDPEPLPIFRNQSTCFPKHFLDQRTFPFQKVEHHTSTVPLQTNVPDPRSHRPRPIFFGFNTCIAARQVQHLRKVDGGLFADAPKWPMDTSTAPVLPSRHCMLVTSATLVVTSALLVVTRSYWIQFLFHLFV